MKKSLIAFALPLAFCLAAFAYTVPAFMPVADGYWQLETATGRVYTLAGKLLPYTFQYAEVRDYDKYGQLVITPLNPLEYASLDTAQKTLAWVQSIDPEAHAVAYQESPVGAFYFSVPQRSVLAYGYLYNCGLIAVDRMSMSDTAARNAMLADLNEARKEQGK
jgi:hypothetical protein